MYNKMLSRELRSRMFDMGQPLEETRRSGRTTGHIFSVIGTAMRNPGKPVSFIEPGFDTVQMIDFTMSELIRTIDHNRLKYLVVNRQSRMLTYELFTPNPWDIV